MRSEDASDCSVVRHPTDLRCSRRPYPSTVAPVHSPAAVPAILRALAQRSSPGLFVRPNLTELGLPATPVAQLSGTPTSGEAVVLSDQRAGLGCDAHVVTRDGFTPHIPLQAGIRIDGCAGTGTGTGKRDHSAPVWPGNVLVDDQSRLPRSPGRIDFPATRSAKVNPVTVMSRAPTLRMTTIAFRMRPFRQCAWWRTSC